MDELNKKSLINELLTTSFEQLRLDIGYPGEITDAPPPPLADAVTDCWTKTVWQFAATHAFTIHDSWPHLQPARQGDKFLMPLFVDLGYQGATLRQLNDCRKYLRVLTLADITTADGTKLLPSIWQGTPPPQTWHKYEWPRRPPSLSSAHWRLWREALSSSCLIPSANNHLLANRLGRWLVDPSQHWNWLYHRPTKTLYGRDTDHWQAYTNSSFRGSPLNKRFRSTDEWHITPPPACHLASITLLSNRATHTESTAVQLTGIYQFDSASLPPLTNQQPDTSSSDTTSVQTRARTLPPQDQWAIDEFQSPDQAAAIAIALTQHTAVAVSDGSFEEGSSIGTSAFVICPSINNFERNTAALGLNQVPGALRDQSAYRSELAGIAGILVALSVICTHYNVTSGSIEIGLDGQSAKDEAAGDWILKARQRDFDMLQDIRARIASLPISCKFRWVRGHQDDDKAAELLDNWALLNIRCDQNAKDYRTQPGLRPRANLRFRHEQWSLSLQGEKLSNFNMQSIYARIFPDTMPYWQAKHGLSDANIHEHINWEALRRAMKRIPLGTRRWLIKHATGHCAVGRMELKRKHQDHSQCPRCHEDDENSLHVLTCSDPRACAHWQSLLHKLSIWMQTHYTSPDIHAGIIKLLTHWHDTGQPLPSWQFSSTTSPAFMEQQDIGVYNFLLGRISSRITALQHIYLRELVDTRQNGTSWTAGLIVQLYDLSFAMWQHRNNILHSPEHPRQLLVRDAILSEVTAQLELGNDNLLACDHHLTLISMAQLKARTDSQLRLWLETVQLARQAYAHHTTRQQEQLQAQQDLLQTWTPQNPAPPPLNLQQRTEQEGLIDEEEEDDADTPTVTPPAATTYTPPTQIPKPTSQNRQRNLLRNWLHTTTHS
jgi:hypothetical protein